MCELDSMLEVLMKVDEKVYALYALSKDVVSSKIKKEQRIQYVNGAIECGRSLAKKLKDEKDNNSIIALANHYRLEIEYDRKEHVKEECNSGFDSNKKMKQYYVDGHINDELLNIATPLIILGLYTKPNHIWINEGVISDACDYLLKKNSNMIEVFNNNSIINTIIGHEVYHYLEEENKDWIYSQTEKILLFQFFKIKHSSTIPALSEIAAMTFAKVWNDLSYSPFLIDFLILYIRDRKQGIRLCKDLLLYETSVKEYVTN